MITDHLDLNSSQTIPSTIIDLVARGKELTPFDEGRHIRAHKVRIVTKKITIVEERINLHRQVKWMAGDYNFSKTFVCQVQAEFGDTKAILKYNSIEENDYQVLREPFWCYEKMKPSISILPFFADVFKTLFSVEKVSNHIVWNYSTNEFTLKGTQTWPALPLSQIDCTQMETLARTIRERSCRHIPLSIVLERLREHYP